MKSESTVSTWPNISVLDPIGKMHLFDNHLNLQKDLGKHQTVTFENKVSKKLENNDYVTDSYNRL